MSAVLYDMPVDRSEITTRLRIRPDFFGDPISFIKEHDLPIRTMKPTVGKWDRSSTKSLTLDVLTFKGIKVKLSKAAGDRLTKATIDFNPGVCLYSHNGRIISLTEFFAALGLLVTHLTPILQDPNDWADLFPGLRSGGRAYWSFLEIPFQCHDPDDTLLAQFRHGRHPAITRPTRHWPTSILIDGVKLKLAIYRKAGEMVAHGKLPPSALSDRQDILRLETRMEEEKLVHYFGNDRNIEVIDEKERLVRFYPWDLVRGHRTCFGELQGVFSSVSSVDANQKQGKKGRLLAQAAIDPSSTHTLPELLSLVQFYTGVPSGDIRKVGLAELESRSSLSKEQIFSDEAYCAQPGVAEKSVEEKVGHLFEDTKPHQKFYDAYQPPDHPFRPITRFASYSRL